MRLLDIRDGEIIVAVEEWEASRLADLSRLAELGAYTGEPTEDRSHLQTVENIMLAGALHMFWEAAGLLAAQWINQSLSEERQREARARQHAGQRQAEAWKRVRPEREPAA